LKPIFKEHIAPPVRILHPILFLALGALVSCSKTGPQNQGKETPLADLRAMKESPSVARLVEAGKLPPLEQRLPQDPLVVSPYEGAGAYGGAWNFDVTTRRDVNLVYHIATPSFFRWAKDGYHFEPYLCKEYHVSTDARIWTIVLRKGVRWSDGHPFTTEDVRFWYEDDALNKDLNPLPKEELLIDNQLGKIEIVDAYTFRVIFPSPYKGFYQKMTSIVLFYVPSHYMKQLHIKYADSVDLELRMKKLGIRKWSELYKRTERWYLGFLDPDVPTLRPWVLSRESSSPNIYEFVRNPYYWAVDTDGRQLPYIDSIVVHVTSNEQVLVMKTIAGDFDFQWSRLEFRDFPLLKENAAKRGYQVLSWPQDRGSDIALYVDYNCTHPTIGPLLRDRRFRIALSLAVNREELNLLFYKNAGVPRQATASEATPFYIPEYAMAYATFDLPGANALLDEMGLTRRDKEGFRLDPAGNPIHLLVETVTAGNTLDILQITSEYWQAIGLRTEVKVVEGSLMTERTRSAEVMIQARPMGSFAPPVPDFNSNYTVPLFGMWKQTGGRKGEEPTAEFKELIRLNDQRKDCSVEEEVEVLKQIYKLYAEHVWMIGLVGEIPALLAKKDYFRNVPDKCLYSYARGRRLGLTLPEQYWIDQGKRATPQNPGALR
jgi:peptide/nickel transport system substrate-binding protein